jgi:hypothetical protein
MTDGRAIAPEAFLHDLGSLEPEIGLLIAEHVRYFEEMVPSLLMADIARWSTRIAHEAADPLARLARLLARFEVAWGDGHGSVSDLIATAFVENVYDRPDVVRLLGPNLMRYYLAYTGWTRPAAALSGCAT